MRTIEDFVNELNLKFPKIKTHDTVFIFTKGKRYYKVYHSRDGKSPNSIYAFVDIASGDIYRAASYNAPALHVRGNINGDLECCEKYGIKALR